MTGDIIRSGMTGATLGGTCASIVGAVDYAFLEVFDDLDTYLTRRRQLKLAKIGISPKLSIAETTDGANWSISAVATTDDLANKADSSWGYISDDADLFVWAAEQPRNCSFSVRPSVTNIPCYGYFCAHLIIGSGAYRTLILTRDVVGEIWQTVHAWNGTAWYWTNWVRLATAAPPQEYDLPLAAGWERMQKCAYFKTQDGIVTVIAALKATANHSDGDVFATLPEGYRPTEHTEVPAIIKSPISTGTMIVHDYGAVALWVLGGVVAGQLIFATASYRAS